MTFGGALDDPVFRTYVAVVAGALAVAGLVLATLRFGFGTRVGSMLATYRGWLVMAPLVLGAVLGGRATTIGGVTVLALLGFGEFARATGLATDRALSWTVRAGIFAVGVLCLVDQPGTGEPGWYGLFMALPAYMVAAVLLVPILRNRADGQLRQTSLAVLGFVYFGWMFGHLAFLANATDALGYLLFLVFAIALTDVAAFSFGRWLGRRKLRDRISPNKTVEGALGALSVALALPWLLRFSFPHFGPLQLVLTGLIVGVGGPLGDLTISFIKRDLGIKDMGASIPGHGGVLDRIDSLIFAAPLFFHMARWFFGLSAV